MTRGVSKFIAEEDILAVADWNFAAVDQASIRFAAKLKAQSDAESRLKTDGEQAKLDAIGQAAHSKGYEEGFAQGHAQATLDGNRKIADYIDNEGREAAMRFAKLFTSAQSQIAEAEQTIAAGVLKLACEIARQVIRVELSFKVDAVQIVVRECVGSLLAGSKTAAVRLNPQDLDGMAEYLRKEFPDFSITLIPDSEILRGGCLAEAAGAVMDATVQSRWQKVNASLGLDTAWESARDDN